MPPSEVPRSRPLLVGVVLAVAFVVVGSSLYALRDVGSGSDGAAFAPGRVVRYPVPGAQPLVFGGGAAWVSGSAGGQPEIYRIDAATGMTTALPETVGAQWVAFGEGYAWATCGGDSGSPCAHPIIMKIDPVSGKVIARISIPTPSESVVTGLGAVWAATLDGIVRIDPVSDRVTNTFTGITGVAQVVVSGGRVWGDSLQGGRIVGLDPTTGAVVATVPFADPCMFTGGPEGVFVASCQGRATQNGDHLIRIDPAAGRVSFTVPLPQNAAGMMALFNGRLWMGGWAPNTGSALLIPLDPNTGQVSGTVVQVKSVEPFGGSGFGPLAVFLAGGADSLWVTHVDANNVIRVGIGPMRPAQPLPTGAAGISQPPSWVVQRAVTMASANGDANPTSAEWVLASYKVIAPAVGLTPDQVSDRQMYLVVLQGQFTDTGAYTPGGVPAPTGTVVAFTIDPTTHQVQDFGVGNQTVDVPGLQPFTLATTNVPTPSPASPPPRLSVTGTLRLPETAFGIAADRGSMWLAAYGHVIGVDASGMTLTANIPVAHLDDQDGIAASAGTAWVTVLSKRKVVAIDEATGKIQGSVKISGQGQPVQVAADGTDVWVVSATSGNAILSHIDAATATVTSQIDLLSSPRMPIVAASGVLWVGEGGGLWQIRADGSTMQIRGVGTVSALAYGGGSLWASSNNELLRIDPASGDIQARIAVFADSLSVAGQTLWGLIMFRQPSVIAIDMGTNSPVGDAAHIGGHPAWIGSWLGSGYFLDYNASRLLRVGAPASG